MAEEHKPRVTERGVTICDACLHYWPCPSAPERLAGPTLCRNCGEAIRWSLDFCRWMHDGESGRVRYCVKNFDANHNPTTEATPIDTVPVGRPAVNQGDQQWPEGAQ